MPTVQRVQPDRQLILQHYMANRRFHGTMELCGKNRILRHGVKFHGPQNRGHNDDCPEIKREDCSPQNCSVLYCVLQPFLGLV